MLGWIRIHRQLQDNELWKAEKFTRGQAWVDILLITNHADNIIFVRGNEIRINRGQFAYSEETLAKRWRWSRDKVRRFLKWLENKQQIIQQKSKTLSLYTVLNYNDYQKNDTTDKTTDKTTEKHQTIQQKNINNNDKNENKKRKESLTTNINKSTYKSITYLQAVPDSDIESLRTGIKVTPEQIRSKAEDLYNYCRSKNKSYSDYKAFLRNALKRDFPEVLKVTPGYRVVNG